MIHATGDVRQPHADDRGGTLVRALLVTLAVPASWPLALAAFLLRGGFVAVLLPIVVLPSPVGLGNVLAPVFTAVAFRGLSGELVAGLGLVLVVLAAWVVVGGLLAALLETEAIRLAVRADDENADAAASAGARSDALLSARQVAARILGARIVAHLPTVAAMTVGSVVLVTVAYRELTSPVDVATPIVIRVLRGAPEAVTAVVAAWMLGEILGGIAARRIVNGGAGVRRALREACAELIRHPLTVLLRSLVPTAALVLVLVPSLLAASAAWVILRIALRSGLDPLAAPALVLFVGVWTVGLLLIGIASAWRGTVWSMGDRRPVLRPHTSASEAQITSD